MTVDPGVLGAQWSAWNLEVRVLVTSPADVDPAADLVRREMAAVEHAASRFRADSEVVVLAADPDGRAEVSPLLAELLTVALFAALATDGAVDPTVGDALVRLGYDRDLPVVRADPRPERVGRVTVRRSTTWRDVRVDDRTVSVPPGTLLDLGATAKAWTADRCATRIAAELGCGALVCLGGDIRVAGPPPAAGWNIRVADGPDEPVSDVRLAGLAAVATSSTLHRTWTTGSRHWHHVLDPRSGLSAEPVWRTASVAAPTCVEANTLSTAALVLGRAAPDMLRAAGRPARLVAADGRAHRFGGWPA